MIRKILAVALAAAVLSVVSAPAASAAFGIAPGSLDITLSTTQAGAHPDLTTTFMMNTRESESGYLIPDGSLKDVRVDLPPGIAGSAAATPRCQGRDLFAVCPVSSQVGVVTIYQSLLGNVLGATTSVFNVVPEHGATAELGFRLAFGQQRAVVRVKPDGSLRTDVPSIFQGLRIAGQSMTLWGVPADPVHDPERGSRYECFIGFENASCSGGGYSSTAPSGAYLTNPTECTGQPLRAHVEVSSWQDRENPLSYDAPMGTITGCDKLQFHPELTIRPSTRAADSPTGLTTDLKIPQSNAPNGLATANLRRAEVTLPPGLTLNPAVANGMAACSDAQLGLGLGTSPSCPVASVVGSATVNTPALPNPLSGSIYTRPQLPGDPYRLAVVLRGEGVTLKIPGSVRADPATGRLTAVFDDTPQQAFSNMELTFDAGPRAALATPPSCGIATSTGLLTPWSAPESGGPAEVSSSFEVRWDETGAACPDRLPFSPGLSAGVTNPVGGASSPFVFEVTREDRQQTLGSIDGIHLPEGLIADVGSVPRCPSDQAAAGTCAAASRIGTVLASAGAGSSPVQVKGRVYLSDGYKGAPFGLVIVVPAVAGPFDLGTVVTRAALRIDPVSAKVTVEADPLPTILQGVPLRLRDIGIEMDRPDFTVNPTNCEEMKLGADLTGTGGAHASPSNRFQVTDCAALGFKPKLSLKLSGATHRSAHPKLRAVLEAREGDANIGKAVVTLPETEYLENEHIQTVCTRVQYAADKCPARSVYGYAKAWSPLLDKPLQGPVYLRSSNHQLPDLVASLDGEIHIDLAGRIDSVNERIRNTFWAVPDAPVSKFVLTMQGGKKGLLVNNEELCKAKPRALVKFTGHNGKVSSSNPLVKADCGKKGGH